MKKKKFEIGKKYRLDLREHLQFGPIKKQDLWSIFTDGRIMGLMNDHLLAGLFKNLSPPPEGKTSKYDVILEGSEKCEVKSVTENGVSFVPSNQRGQARKTDPVAYEKRRKCIHVYIFVDIVESPDFSIIGFRESDVPKQRGMNRNSFQRMTEKFRPKPKEIILSL